MVISFESQAEIQVITKTLIERFSAKYQVNPKTGCWDWTAAKLPKGYGVIKIPKQRNYVYAHRLSYMFHVGPIGEGVSICHRCDNPGCVNPEHLFAGSTADNLQDMKAKGRHLYGEKNAVSKLTEADVERIHDLHVSGQSTYVIAKAEGLGQMTVWRIVNGHRWEHIYERRRGSSGPA